MAFFMTPEELKYLIALTLIKRVGILTAKRLIAYTGSAKAIFSERSKALLAIPRIPKSLLASLKDPTYIADAEKEIAFIEKNNIQAISYLAEEYPKRLKHCEDAPLIIYKKGKHSLEGEKIISIVGTRNSSIYGKEQCKMLIEGLKAHNAVIVSGLAYGIDFYAHTFALENNMDTIAVVGHSLNTIYPADHIALSREIREHGGIISEFHSNTPLDRYNFVTRNRIIAGISDATVVIESAKKGGALITAEHANNYNRDVFAYPGKSSDTYSKGCNHLIKTHKAHLIEGIEDLEYILNWDKSNKQVPKQKQLFIELSTDDKLLLHIIKEKHALSMDLISLHSNMPMSKVSAIMLNLEFSGLVRLLPGKVYEFCG